MYSLQQDTLDYLWNVTEGVQAQSARAALSSFKVRQSQRENLCEPSELVIKDWLNL